METYEGMLVSFKDWVTSDKSIKQLWTLNNNGQADYIDADTYARKVSKQWSNILTSAYEPEEVARYSDEIARAYKKAYAESAYYSKNVQKGINAKLGVNMRAIEPKIDDEQIYNLIGVLDNEDTTLVMASHLLSDSAIQPVTRSAVADTIKSNARMQSRSGLHAYVERDAGAGCCAWCSSIAGRYEFGEQPKDFFAVHNGCTCTINYKPSRERDAVRLQYNASQRRFTE